MRSARKTTETKVRTKKSSQDDLATPTKVEEKVKKTVYSVSTPRNYIPKSSAADIYARKKPAMAPKKIPITPRSNESPMKDLLRSSPSTTSHISSKSSKEKNTDIKTTPTVNSTSRSMTKKSVLSNVTVNSPVVKKRLNMEVSRDSSPKASASRHPTKDSLPGRQRTKTRTLEEDEVKILTPKAIDNNAAMQDLSRKLTAQPKAFYVELEKKPRGPKVEIKQRPKSSDEDEVSYEDDFESYESDFESYQSEAQSEETSMKSEETSEGDDQRHSLDDTDEYDEASKEVKDDEKMLDSGNFDLRDSQRSGSRKPAVMDFILEGSEDVTDDKKASLTDEGFQEMSSSSTVPSMRIVHTEVLERPLFIDFTKSKENKRKRKILEKLKQRAKDILSMVTLHEMSYSLFEMKPIPYDLYMVTFGRKNYTQVAIQTFEDNVSEEVQTDDIVYENKWTQFPIEFSSNDITFEEKIVNSNDINLKEETLISKFEYLINQDTDRTNIVASDKYKTNPLKIFLEQKEGAGSDKMLPEESFKAKLKSSDYNVNKLRKFLNKSERRLSSILSLNVDSNEALHFVKRSKLPFSKGYLSISPNNLTDDKFNFLKCTKTIGVAISETKENLIMTYHKKHLNKEIAAKCFVCLWDTSIARSEPLKVLKATDTVLIGRYRGNTNGVFAAALEDRTLHVWDLSEEPTWYSDVASSDDGKTTKLVDVDASQMSEVEIDREWNLKNSQVGYNETPQSMMQVSAYTSSAINMYSKDSVDNIVALEFVGDQRQTHQDGGRKIITQICILQRLGILLIWSIIQEKISTHDIGKAYWSKVKLEKNQTVHLSEYLDIPINDSDNNFNLNAAKRRLSNRKQERIERKKDLTRPKSAILKNLDRPNSVASPRDNEWNSEVICNHMKVLRLNKMDNYLVASGNGEVYCCKRNLADFKVDRLCVATDRSSITRLEVTPSNLPYFLAATDSGTINLCSILDARILLTLDCRNGPPTTTMRCQADHKGRFVASVPEHSPTEVDARSKYNCNLSIRCLSWSPANPFCILAVLPSGAVVAWELTHSDINARSVVDCAALDTVSSRGCSMALLTKEGEVQIHRLSNENNDRSSIDLFKKYMALL